MTVNIENLTIEKNEKELRLQNAEKKLQNAEDEIKRLRFYEQLVFKQLNPSQGQCNSN